MKTHLKFLLPLMLMILKFSISAQTTYVCMPNSATLTAVNSAGLSNPAYSMNPGGITSANGQFVVTPTSSVTYTLYVTGLNQSNTLTTTSTFSNVQAVGGVTFGVSSPSNYSLVCGFPATTTINIINASVYPPNGGFISYAFIPPGTSTPLPANGTLTAFNSTVVSTPGTWTVAVRNAGSQCTSYSQVAVSGSTTSSTSWTVPVPTLLDCNNPATVLQAPIAPNLTYSWSPGGSQSSSLAVSVNTSISSFSVAGWYDLTITDVSSNCTASTTIKVIQNILPPNAAIFAPGSACQPSMVLTNISTTGITGSPSPFPNPLPVVASLWQGPPPQQPQSLTSTYLAQTTGIYTLTAKDMNNGCEASTTIAVNLPPQPSFAYVNNAGQVTFSNTSAGSNNNNNYFWNFGDGNTSTLQHPVHYYVSAGSYLVKLKITDANGLCPDSTQQIVTLTNVPCIPNATFAVVPTGTPQLWYVIPTYPWNVMAATWDWGDNSTSNALYSSHQYSAAGMYNICLTVSVSCGATASACASYSVYRGTQSGQMISVSVQAPELISGLTDFSQGEKIRWKAIPNPNSGDFSIEANFNPIQRTKINIVDLQGKILSSEFVESGQNKMDFRDLKLSPGIYMIQTNDGHTQIIERLVIIQ